MVTLSECYPASITLRDLELVDEAVKPLQTVRYYRSGTYGGVLTIDKEIHHVEAWEPFYHEMLVHFPIAFLQHVQSVLILGGGSLFAAREIEKYKQVKTITLVDHDLDVIKFTLKMYPYLSDTLGDSRFEIVNEDALCYLKKTKTKFDLIVNDGLDMQEVFRIGAITPNELLERLMPKGIVTDVFYRSIYDPECTCYGIRALDSVPNKAFSLVVVPEYPGFFHLLSAWGCSATISQSRTESICEEQYRIKNEGGYLWFDPHMMRYYLYVPKYLRQRIKCSLC